MDLLHSPEPIVEYMRRRGMSQKQFAALVQVSQSAVSQWITGSRGMEMRTAKRIEKRTKGGVTVRALFRTLFEKAA